MAILSISLARASSEKDYLCLLTCHCYRCCPWIASVKIVKYLFNLKNISQIPSFKHFISRNHEGKHASNSRPEYSICVQKYGQHLFEFEDEDFYGSSRTLRPIGRNVKIYSIIVWIRKSFRTHTKLLPGLWVH